MDISIWAPYLSAAEIIIAITVVVLVLVQSKGADLGGFLGGGSGETTSRTKRGVEATMHRLTMITFVVFFLLTVLTFISLGQTS